MLRSESWLVSALRFVGFMASILAASMLAHYLIDQIGVEGPIPPRPYVEWPGLWYLIPLAWAVLVTSCVFASILDYPKFRPWHRFDKALLAGFIAAVFPLLLVGLYDWSLPGDSVGPLLMAKIRLFDWPRLNLIFDVSLHLIPALLICSSRSFMPNRPQLLPFGFLYCHVLVTAIVIMVHTYLYLTVVFVMGK